MQLAGKKIAIFIADLYEDKEYWIPYYRLKEEGAEVVTIGPEEGVCAGKNGIPARADEGIGDVDPSAFDGLVIPGGYAPDLMRRHRDMVDFVRVLHERGRPVAAICHAGWMLASAGVLRGRKVTSFFSIRDDMVNAGAEWVDEEVVVDGGLITSRTPDDLPAFCRAFIEAIA